MNDFAISILGALLLAGGIILASLKRNQFTMPLKAAEKIGFSIAISGFAMMFLHVAVRAKTAQNITSSLAMGLALHGFLLCGDKTQSAGKYALAIAEMVIGVCTIIFCITHW